MSDDEVLLVGDDGVSLLSGHAPRGVYEPLPRTLTGPARTIYRNRHMREGAALYYLHAICGYTAEEIAAMVPHLQEYQVEELVLLGMGARHDRPDLWRALVRR
jgi:hypothetical protein